MDPSGAVTSSARHPYVQRKHCVLKAIENLATALHDEPMLYVR